MRNLAQDIRFAIRTLLKTPAFTLLSVVTLALGIGASTAAFSMIHGVLLRRLPYAGDARLVHIMQPSATRPDAAFSVLEVSDYRKGVESFAATSEYHTMPFQLFGKGDPKRVQTGVVSDNFFGVLGVRPLLGRLFSPGEEAVGAPPVVLLSYRFWRDELGSDPAIVGSTFTMNDKVHTVIGVLPPLPNYPDENNIWMPAGACPFRSAPATMSNRSARLVSMFAVLKPGVDVARATSEVQTLAQRMHQEYPEAYPARAQLQTPKVVPLRVELTESSRPLLLTLVAAAAFLLIIAAANFANLSLARQLRCGREMALRAALGAGRRRLLHQLVTESLCVTVTGGVLGVLVAFSAIGLLRTIATRVTPRGDEISVDAVVLAFALVASIVVGLVAAMAPLYKRTDDSLIDDLRSGAAATTGARGDSRTRDVLVGVQVAVAFVLLAGAGLMVRSLMRLERVDAGYDPSRVMTARVVLDWTRYTFANRDAIRNFSDQLLTRLENEPGVVAATVASDFPLNNGQPSAQPFLTRETGSAESGNTPQSDVSIVGPEYFKVVGIPVLAGRAFTAADRDTASIPAIINQRLADTYWPRGTALGQELSLDNGVHWRTIVGIVGDVRQNSLSNARTDEIYLPFEAVLGTDIRVLVRTAGNPAPVAAQITRAVREIDPREPVVSIQSLEELRGVRLAEPRTTTVLLGSFAILAVIITAAGLTGVIGYSVNQRVAEIGVRVALGATKPSIVWLIVQRGLLLAAGGLLVGAATALGVTRIMSSLLYSTPPRDPATFVVVGVWLIAVATLACIVPARRALSIDPVLALKSR
jgi:predicted permease